MLNEEHDTLFHSLKNDLIESVEIKIVETNKKSMKQNIWTGVLISLFTALFAVFSSYFMANINQKNQKEIELNKVIVSNYEKFSDVILEYNNQSITLYQENTKNRHEDVVHFTKDEIDENREKLETVKAKFNESYIKLVSTINPRNTESEEILEEIKKVRATNNSISLNQIEKEVAEDMIKNDEYSIQVSENLINKYLEVERNGIFY